MTWLCMQKDGGGVFACYFSLPCAALRADSPARSSEIGAKRARFLMIRLRFEMRIQRAGYANYFGKELL